MTGLVWEARVHLVGESGRRLAGGILVSLAAIAAATGLLLALRGHVPVLSLGAIYILAVLPVAVISGTAYAAFVAVASMLVFNFLFLPPTLTLTLSGGENWLVLTVYLITGLLVSDLAARARRRAREAEQREREAAFLAELASGLLSRTEAVSEIGRVEDAVARILGLPVVRIGLEPPFRAKQGEDLIGLVASRVQVGALFVPSGTRLSLPARLRFLPALASVLGMALDRERLAKEALEAETLRQSDLLKTALLRTVSHDLRSPLTAIKASLEALITTDLAIDEGHRDALVRSALAESERLDRTVRNLLDLSRLQAGAARPQARLRTVEGLLDQAIGQLGSRQRLAVAIPDDLPLVKVDAIQVEHALVNLLENALKFSPPESIVQVECARSSNEVVVRIVDRGAGLSQDELERIFEPFGHGSTARDRRGPGLGLAIARGFLEANGGRVWAEPGRAEGSCFWVALPVALAAADALPA